MAYHRSNDDLKHVNVSVNRSGVRSRHRHCPRRKAPSFEGSEVSPEIVSRCRVFVKMKAVKTGKGSNSSRIYNSLIFVLISIYIYVIVYLSI